MLFLCLNSLKENSFLVYYDVHNTQNIIRMLMVFGK